MTENRLELLDPDLSAHLKTASSSQLRAAAKVSCRFALQHTSLSNPILARGLEALEKSNYENSLLQTKLQSFVTELDGIQWDLQEKMDVGSTELSTYLAAFHRARAANSVYWALDADAFVAATESIYEAHAATDNLVILKPMILTVLNPESANSNSVSSGSPRYEG